MLIKKKKKKKEKPKRYGTLPNDKASIECSTTVMPKLTKLQNDTTKKVYPHYETSNQMGQSC